MINEIQNAKELFYQKKYKQAFEIFESNNEFYYAGLCCLLQKDLDKAKKLFEKNKDNCPACEFGLVVIDYINNKREKIPSFFQTRAFLEVYISLFIENHLEDYCESLISACDTLFNGNPEAYKFIARALFANGYFDLAITFCKKSLDLFYSDPEALLIVAQCYYLINNKTDALNYIKKLRRLIKDYYPAILFEEILIKDLRQQGMEI